jgi:hypothetical protein
MDQGNAEPFEAQSAEGGERNNPIAWWLRVGERNLGVSGNLSRRWNPGTREGGSELGEAQYWRVLCGDADGRLTGNVEQLTRLSNCNTKSSKMVREVV